MDEIGSFIIFIYSIVYYKNTNTKSLTNSRFKTFFVDSLD